MKRLAKLLVKLKLVLVCLFLGFARFAELKALDFFHLALF